MKITEFSEKQKQLLTFVVDKRHIVVADGAVRCGKSVVGLIGFTIWAMSKFDHCMFGICGKTVKSCENNLIAPLQTIEGLPYRFNYNKSKHILTVSCHDKHNYFVLYEGYNSKSKDKIQGATLAGIFFDEATILDEEFMNVARTRCVTYKNYKLWFNCNPASPKHWLYQDFILQAEEKHIKRIHFYLEDNPILDAESIEEIKSGFEGVFYQRYILGEWVLADGLVYSSFNYERDVLDFSAKIKEMPAADYDDFCRSAAFYVSMDYGITNPCTAHLWCLWRGVSYCIREYYQSSGDTGQSLTDEEHYENIDRMLILAGVDNKVDRFVIDPSASSFKQVIKRHDKYIVQNANNSVLNGISLTQGYMRRGMIKIDKSCKHLLEEFGLYCWDSDSLTDAVIKEFDHCCDSMRYYVNSIMVKEVD